MCTVGIRAQLDPIPAPKRIAFIYSHDFLDEDKGIPEAIEINRIIRKLAETEREKLINADSTFRAAVMEYEKDTAAARRMGCSMSKLEMDRIKGLQLKAYNVQLLKYAYEEKVEELKTEHYGPVQEKIRNALVRFAEQNGYTSVFDLSKVDLCGAGYCISILDEPNITKDFIEFYRATVDPGPSGK